MWNSEKIKKCFKKNLVHIFLYSHFYTQIEKKGVKFSHETAKNQEQLSQEIILNDYKG